MKNERYKLWEFFKEEHDLTLTDGQLHDVVYEVELYLNKKLRDYFAAKAMCAAIANPDIKGINNEIIAKAAYTMADAMLKQREQ